MRLRRILVSAKDLQKSLEDANISVDESTIRKTLNKSGVHGRTPWKKPLLSNSKDRRKSTTEWLEQGLNRRKYAFWSGPVSPDLNPIEML